MCQGTPAQRQLASCVPDLVLVEFTELVTPIPNYRFGDLSRNVTRAFWGKPPEELDAYFVCALPESGRRYETTLLRVMPGQAANFRRSIVFRQEGETECHLQPVAKRAIAHEATVGNSSLSGWHKATAAEKWDGRVWRYGGGVCKYQEFFDGEEHYFEASICIKRAV